MNVNTKSKIISVGIYDLLTHPYQPRFDEETGISELAESIQEFGILNKPKVVMHPTEPGKYYIVAGHRRIKAAKSIGVQLIEVELLEVDDPRVPLVDNMFRRDISPIELAFFFKKAIADSVFVTPESICASTGRERFYVDILIDFSKLDEDLFEDFMKYANSKTLNNIVILGMFAKLYHSAQPNVSKKYVLGALAELIREEEAFGFTESDAKDTLADAMNDLKAELKRDEESGAEDQPEEKDEEPVSMFDEFSEEEDDDDFDFEETSSVSEGETKQIKDLGLEVTYDDDWNSVFIRINTSDMSSSAVTKLQSVFDKLFQKLN